MVIQMEIRKNIKVSLKDYFFFNLGLVKKTIITYVIILLFVCVAFNGIMNGFNFESVDFWLKSLLFYGIGLIVLCGYFVLLIYFASKKVYTPNKQYYENMELVIDDKGIHQYSNGAESGLTYDQIFKSSETRRVFIILVGPRQGLLIPKKGFTLEELEEIRKRIKK